MGVLECKQSHRFCFANADLLVAVAAGEEGVAGLNDYRGSGKRMGFVRSVW